MKFLLLRVIPIPVKTVLFGFRQVDGKIYMKMLDTKSKGAQYLTVKDPSTPVPASWVGRASEYEVANASPNSATMHPYALKCLKNKIVLYRKDGLSDLTDEVGFNAIDDQVAISDGIDRGSGATLKVLPNGNLYYSGFELRKQRGKPKS